MKLIRRVEIPLPTMAGLALFVGALLAVALLLALFAYPILAPNQPVRGQALVVEGWIHRGIIDEVADVFREGGYRWLVTTRGALPASTFLRKVYPDVDTYAHLAERTLLELGVGPDSLIAIPAPPVERYRTYAGAVRIGEWIESTAGVDAVDILTQGAHGRRSWVLYSMGIGGRARVGVISRPPVIYDPDRWWASSAGARTLMSEAIAYVYFKFFFYP